MPTSEQIAKKPRRRWAVVLLVVLALFWGAVGLGLWHVVPGARNFYMPASSMAPTLSKGDYVFADMHAYKEKEPERGDVILFLIKRDRKTIWTKRIIGLPGDRIEMRNGNVILNGKLLPQKEADDFFFPEASDKQKKPVKRKFEILPNGRRYAVLDLVADGDFDNVGPYDVPEGHYFVLGDNRDNSNDSRMLIGFGMVAREDIVGRMSVIYWSRDFSKIGTGVK